MVDWIDLIVDEMERPLIKILNRIVIIIKSSLNTIGSRLSGIILRISQTSGKQQLFFFLMSLLSGYLTRIRLL